MPYSSYARLMRMLAEGWQIQSPVYVRPRWLWNSESRSENTYYFVLWHEDRVNLTRVLDCPEIRQFLRASKLAIDSL